MAHAIRVLLFTLLALAPTLVDAQRLPDTVQPEHYDLAFDVDLAGGRFSGIETIRVRLTQPLRRIVLHALEIEFDAVEVVVSGQSQPATVTAQPTTQTVALTVPREMPAGPAEIRVRYHARLNTDLRGFYLSTANNRRYAVTQFESTDARRAFPSFDEPAFKATFSVAITVADGDTAISNGRMLSDTPGPGAGRHTLTFDRTARMSPYLVAMAVGDFTCIGGEADGTPVRICATPDKAALRQVALDAALQILPYLNRYYSVRYPFGKLDVVAVPDFAAGAMENTAAIFYRETDLLADPATASVGNLKRIWIVLAHEMAHQWFGDLVTMQWWNDLWLNEGFATWMEGRPLAALKPEWNIAVDQAADTQFAMNIDGLGATRAIRNPVETPAEIEASFDGIAYEKSAAVLRMIEGWVGEETFRTGVNAYIEAHAYGNATAEDFWSAVTRASGKPVDQVLATYVSRPGVPLVSVSGDCAAQTAAGLRLSQERFFIQPPQGAAVLRGQWQIPICAGPGGSGTCTLLTTPTAPQACPAAGLPFLNGDARGYFRTAYPPAMLRAFAGAIDRLTAPERLSLAADEWALVRAGQHSAGDYLTLVSGYSRETSSGVLREVTGRLGTIHQLMTSATTTRPSFERFVRDLLQPALAAIGFAPRPSDDTETRERRAALIGTLGLSGNDTDVRREARSALERALSGGAPLEPTAADAIIGVAAASGDATLWSALERAASEANSPLQRERYLFALARFSDPALIDRGLRLTLGDVVRSQDTARLLAAFLRNPEARDRAWAFIKTNWAALEPKVLVSGGDANLASALGAFCDARSRRDIQQFFATHKLPTAGRALEQTYESIGSCVALREKQTPAVSAWLSARR